MIINDIFSNWNKGCYIASLRETISDDNGNEVNYYDKPKYYEFNIEPATGQTDIALYGERVSKIFKTYISLQDYLGVFKEGDKVYYEGVEPQNEDENTYGIGANYKIISVRPQNTVILIRFEKI